MYSLKFICFLVFCSIVAVQSQEYQSQSPSTSSSTPASLTDSAFRAFRKVYSICEDDDDLVKCFKVQALKLTDRALKVQNFKIFDGLALVKKNGNGNEDARALNEISSASDIDFMKMSSDKVNQMLNHHMSKFFDTHQIQLNFPRLLSTGQAESGRLVEEGRKKMKKYLGPFMAALALKGGILTMVYHSIAIVAGKALIIGKIALIISAIIGLKKLVTPEGHEKTTYEIVKHPQVQQSHSFSSSHGGEFEGHEQQFRRRSFNTQQRAQDRAYRGYVKH